MFYAAKVTLTFLGCSITGNRATGGAAGAGGSAGQGMGGLYITPGGTAYADAFTLIIGNDASTSDDDVFGDLSFL